jgi:hypothetical protein
MITPPCDGCRHAPRCKAENLACEAFVLFKRFGTSPERWAYAPRFPNADIYERAHAPVKASTPAVRKRPVVQDLEIEK